ncbi:MAG: hypothetical protein ISS79_00575 [Phycisphaerae bacterium]|nr:hypothetical protein [Phycisphaerae bacterium]
MLSDTIVINGEWHLLTSTYDGSEMRMYVDGQLETSLAYSDDYDSPPLFSASWPKARRRRVPRCPSVAKTQLDTQAYMKYNTHLTK